jgi:uncharacterized protein YbjT (DUF2867 family)
LGHPQRIFVSGGTGYIGSRLIPLLHARGHDVVALVRETSRRRLPAGCTPLVGDALNGDTYRHAAANADTFVQLISVHHPSPAKAQQFVDVDLKSGLEAVRIAREAAVRHFIYLSVAHPAPVMQAYAAVRIEVEKSIAENRLDATILRPWYVLGPGHRWPYALIPFYKIAEMLPQTRDSAVRLGLVTIRQMLGALRHAVENPSSGMRILEPKDIRRESQLAH